MSPEQIHSLQKAGQVIDLIDVRTSSEYQSLHAESARSIPLDGLTAGAATANRRSSSDEPLYIICQSGGRSRTACDRLASAGVKVVNVEGGTTAWQRAGLPVVKTPGGSPGLPPAIRLGAVALVMVLLVLGVTIHFAFLWAAATLWVTLLVANRGCPLCSCAVTPRGGATSACSTGDKVSEGPSHPNA